MSHYLSISTILLSKELHGRKEEQWYSSNAYVVYLISGDTDCDGSDAMTNK